MSAVVFFGGAVRHALRHRGDVAVDTCVEIKIYGTFVLNHRVVLHAIDATPARWRVMPVPHRSTSQDGRAVHPTHWSISHRSIRPRNWISALVLLSLSQLVSAIMGGFLGVLTPLFYRWPMDMDPASQRRPAGYRGPGRARQLAFPRDRGVAPLMAVAIGVILCGLRRRRPRLERGHRRPDTGAVVGPGVGRIVGGDDGRGVGRAVRNGPSWPRPIPGRNYQDRACPGRPTRTASR